MIPADVERSLSATMFPVAAIAIVTARSWQRAGGPRVWLGLNPSPPVPTVLWVVGYAVWMLASNAILHWRGPWDFSKWQQMSLLAATMSVLAVGVLGPAAEELIFRGTAFHWLQPKIGAAATIALTAVVWAVLHVQYQPGIIALIVIDGVLLGIARYQTGSVIAPLAMHIVWNLYAVW